MVALWADKMMEEYKETRKLLIDLKENANEAESSIISGMINETAEVITKIHYYKRKRTSESNRRIYKMEKAILGKKGKLFYIDPIVYQWFPVAPGFEEELFNEPPIKPHQKIAINLYFLPKRQREIFKLYINGITQKEISEYMSITERVVSRDIRLAKEKYRMVFSKINTAGSDQDIAINLDFLSKRQREALELYVNGITLKEISEYMGVTKGAVSKHIHLAKEKCRKVFCKINTASQVVLEDMEKAVFQSSHTKNV